MKEFIAKYGYTLAWAIGTPKVSLEEGFEDWFNFGLISVIIFAYLIILGIISLLALLTLGKDKSE